MSAETPPVIVDTAKVHLRAAIELDGGRIVNVRRMNYAAYKLKEIADRENTPEAWYDLAAYLLPSMTPEEVRDELSGDQIAGVVALAQGRVNELLALIAEGEAGKAAGAPAPTSGTTSATS